MTAINFGSVDVVKCFLKHNANVNHTRTTDGMTPLMFAALAGDSQKTKLLLYYKANKKTRDLNGKTALDWVNDGQSRASEKTKSELRTLLR
jgi:ankyrin repeat protein